MQDGFNYSYIEYSDKILFSLISFFWNKKLVVVSKNNISCSLNNFVHYKLNTSYKLAAILLPTVYNNNKLMYGSYLLLFSENLKIFHCSRYTAIKRWKMAAILEIV